MCPSRLDRRVNFALIGLGGYGATVLRVLRTLSTDATARLRLGGAFDPDFLTHASTLGALRDEGVRTYADLAEALADPATDAVWLPVPIGWHRRMTESALLAGKAVVVEKPAAGSVADVDAMIDAERRAARPVLVAFQDVFERTTAVLKRRLLAGRIGRVRRVTILATWPRDAAYYARNAWAGRACVDGVAVFDSPANNALAHPIHLALFLLGADEASAAGVTVTAAETYRVNPIETYDTLATRATIVDGSAWSGHARLSVYLTHACRRTRGWELTIEGDAGRLVIDMTQATFDGEPPLRRSDGRFETARVAADVLRGHPRAVVANLATARAHASFVEAIAAAGPTRDVPGRFVQTVTSDAGLTVRAIVGIERTFQRRLADGLLPGEAGDAPWATLGDAGG